MLFKMISLLFLISVIICYRFVPAYSTRLKFESGYWNVLHPNSSDPLGAVDPVWTESNWNTIGLRMYTIQATAYDRFVLLGGITTTILAYFAIVAVRSSIIKALKRDWYSILGKIMELLNEKAEKNGTVQSFSCWRILDIVAEVLYCLILQPSYLSLKGRICCLWSFTC